MRDGVETDGGFVGNFFESLPEWFVANALGLTSPRDVCRLSLVCPVFRSAAEWDVVWEKFLPPDYQKILAEADGGGGPVTSGSNKEMYLRLCDHHVIIDGGNMSFSLDKCTGKKCYMLAARYLTIVCGNTPQYWRWISIPESSHRLTEVAELKLACWLEVSGTINTSMLSTNTRYASYLVYKITSHNYSFESQPVEVFIRIHGVESGKQTAFLDPGSARSNGPKMRLDGWLEIELGDYFNERGEEGELEMRVMEVKGGKWKCVLFIQGIEIRPKSY